MEYGPDARSAQLRAELTARGLPVLELADPVGDAAVRFAGTEHSDGLLTTIRLVYRASGGIQATVVVARWAGTRVDSGPLRWLVEHDMRQRGEHFSAVAWHEEEYGVVLDGEVLPGRLVRAGADWWAVRSARGDTEVSVVARGWHPDRVRLRTVADPTPLLDLPGARPGISAAPPEPVPEQLRDDPRRALVLMTLDTAEQRADWLADGGPAPRLPAYWSALWRAAVAQQMSSAGQPETTARGAISGMVGQLTTLRDRAAWFRTDRLLRERAISETLTYGAGGGDGVPSLPAQLAWSARQAHGDGAEPAATVEAEDRWLSAWSDWVVRHKGEPGHR
jgi:hypothetical protein